jgi:hypothetical protein
MKYAKVGAVVRWSGGTTVLNLNMSADDDHPLVVERPDLFQDEAPGAELKHPYRGREVPAEEAPVERGTRAPGEKRTTRRSQKEQGDESNDE